MFILFCAENKNPGTNCLDPGYEMINRDCYDIDECATETHNCLANYTCINNAGSFTCDCGEGYTSLEDESCVDINECELEENNCKDYGTCTNTIGSYICDGDYRVYS